MKSIHFSLASNLKNKIQERCQHDNYVEEGGEGGRRGGVGVEGIMTREEGAGWWWVDGAGEGDAMSIKQEL
jgi:hypothetical protein